MIDLSKIASLLNKYNNLSVAHTAETLKVNGVRYCIMGNDNNEIIAVAGIIKTEDIASKIKHVVVDPKYRNNGLGKRIVNFAISLCTTPYVYCYVRRDNTSSLILFLKLGFRIIRIEKGQTKEPLILLGRKTQDL